MRIRRRARIGSGDFRNGKPLRIHLPQRVIGKAGFMVVKRHAGITRITRDMDIERIVVERHRIERQMGFQHPPTRCLIQHRDDDIVGDEEGIEPGMHLHHRRRRC